MLNLCLIHPLDCAPKYQIPLAIHDFHSMIMYHIAFCASYHFPLPTHPPSFSTLLSALESWPVWATYPGSLALRLPAGDSQWQAWQEMRSGEESEVGAFTPLAPSLRGCLRLATSLDKSHCSSQGTLLLITLSFHIQRPLLRFTLADLGVVIVLSLLALGSWAIPCTSLTPLHTFIISLLINKHFLNCPNLNVPSISHWETDLNILKIIFGVPF